jgi:RNA polymerase sigma factor (sigma-70 family)
MTDSQLIREIKDGNVQAYSQLMNRYERKIFAFIFHMLKSAKLEFYAEDLCNETFYKAYRSLHSYREGEAAFSTWLYTIARNTVLSAIRKHKNSDISMDKVEMLSVASTHNIPEQTMLRNEKVMMVRAAINTLPEKQKTALILREYHQLGYQEIADVIGHTVSSVKSLLFRARESIKVQLESYVTDVHDDKYERID